MSNKTHRLTRRPRSVLLGLTIAAFFGGAASGCSSIFGPEVKTLFVASQLVDCVGVGPRTCMRVRENPADDWSLFYDGIEGFTFEPGFFYELEVEIHQVGNPPADGSTLRYVLRRLVRKIAEQPQLHRVA